MKGIPIINSPDPILLYGRVNQLDTRIMQMVADSERNRVHNEIMLHCDPLGSRGKSMMWIKQMMQLDENTRREEFFKSIPYDIEGHSSIFNRINWFTDDRPQLAMVLKEAEDMKGVVIRDIRKGYFDTHLNSYLEVPKGYTIGDRTTYETITNHDIVRTESGTLTREIYRSPSQSPRQMKW